MTPTEEARFIALWQAGTEQAEICQRLGIQHTRQVEGRTHGVR